MVAARFSHPTATAHAARSTASATIGSDRRPIAENSGSRAEQILRAAGVECIDETRCTPSEAAKAEALRTGPNALLRNEANFPGVGAGPVGRHAATLRARLCWWPRSCRGPSHRCREHLRGRSLDVLHRVDFYCPTHLESCQKTS